MAFSPLSRRMFLRHMPGAAAAAGALVSTAVLAAPVAEAVKPVFVKVGSPSFSVSPEIAAAVREWQAAVKVKDDALDAYSGPNAPKHRLPVDHPLRSAWIEADDVAARAQWKLLKLLSGSV